MLGKLIKKIIKATPVDYERKKTYAETLSIEKLLELRSFSSPPKEIGLPVYTVDDLLVSQQQIIREIRYLVADDDDGFERDFMGIIRKFTEYVCLLPASKDHHHFTPSGLLRHSLEVAYYSYKKAKSVSWMNKENSEKRRHMGPRWQMACFIGGLIHDIGKVATDIEVYDETGKLRWEPLEMSLMQWCELHHMERYYYSWNTKREHNAHMSFNVAFWKAILPQHITNYLVKYDKKILQTLIVAISSETKKKENPIADIVLQFDQKSVKQNRAGSASLHNKMTLDIPRETILLNGIKDMLLQHRWKVNKPGARCWLDEEGVYIVWHAGFSELRAYLMGSGHKGIPADPDIAADLMIEREIVDEFITDSGEVQRYWVIEPKIDGINATKMTTIKISRHDLIFDEIKPEKIEILYPNRKDTEPKKKKTKKNESLFVDSLEPEVNNTLKVEQEEKGIEKENKRNKEPKDEEDNTSKGEQNDPVMNFFMEKKLLGELMINIAEDIENKTLVINNDYTIDKEKYGFRSPNVIEQYGFDNNTILSEMMKEGWLEIDPEFPNRKLHRINFGGKQVNTFILKKNISKKLKQLLELHIEEQPKSEIKEKVKEIKRDQESKEINALTKEEKIPQQMIMDGMVASEKSKDIDLVELILNAIDSGEDIPAWREEEHLYIDHDKIYKWFVNRKNNDMDVMKIKTKLLRSEKRIQKKGNNKGMMIINDKRCIVMKV